MEFREWTLLHKFQPRESDSSSRTSKQREPSDIALHNNQPDLPEALFPKTKSMRKAKKQQVKHLYDCPQVHIRVVFMKVNNIDTVKETFSADIFVQATWREPALDIKAKNAERPGEDELWKPEIVLRNIIETSYKKKWKEVGHNKAGEAFVCEKKRIKGTFTESMDLHDFPFDTQHFSVVITSEDQELEFIEDAAEASHVNRTSFVDTKEWHIYDIVEFVPDDEGEEELGDDQHTSKQPVMVARMYASRKSGFYVFNILLVMGVLSCLAMCAWSVDRYLPTNRLQLTFTLVLTAVTFKFVMNAEVPKVPYTTLLGRNIMMCLALLVYCSAWHTLICFSEKDSWVGEVADFIGFIVFVALYFGFQIIFVIVVRCKVVRKRSCIQRLEAQYKSKVAGLVETTMTAATATATAIVPAVAPAPVTTTGKDYKNIPPVKLSTTPAATTGNDMSPVIIVAPSSTPNPKQITQSTLSRQSLNRKKLSD